MPGPHDRRVFTSTESEDHARLLALEGLVVPLKREEKKRVVTDFRKVFPKTIPIHDSTKEVHWDTFWKNKPAAVGIDTEGNNQTPPMLVQVATPDYCIVEVPQNNKLSCNLQRLLDDTSIVKVLCDGLNGHDKICLGLSNKGSPIASVVDLEALMASVFGPVSGCRGLARIVTLCMPELRVQIRKPPRKKRFSPSTGVSPFILMEMGQRKRPSSIRDLSKKELQYCALDAWCTLQAYQRLMKL
jgi:3'-5' exonuclease